MPNKNQSILKNYSINLLNNYPEIKESRKICKINDIFSEISDYDELENFSSTSLRLKINIARSETVYTHKISRTGEYMKWHCDDAVIISHKKKYLQDNRENYLNQIKISDNKTLFYPNKIPKYTLLVYGSTYKKNFTGGTLEFSDGLKIKPEKNMCILFDSREAHCVHTIRSGVKKLILIKFY